MLTKNIKLSDLQVLLDKTFGKYTWTHWEPETVMLEFQCTDYMVAEKIYILQALNQALNSVISLPEFLLWTTSLTNNEPAEFETLNMPSCLELAWCLEEVKKVGKLIGAEFKATPELIDVISYLLRLEGFSTPIYPFDFIPENKLSPGQTDQDTLMKGKAISTYIKHMNEPQENANA